MTKNQLPVWPKYVQYVELFAFTDADIKAQEEAVTNITTSNDVKVLQLSCEETDV